ncbi:DUF4349 domain-containing protein [Mucilaginibacter psychrotolerans]|uniref:DUF4349 domain-containing protein n=1 Tax=Mucilaginibacter psychrotolerans TaxID=1524096 RepID=A0A4Y8S3S4_9SPHI|nr:DUF4349 domain-containing protein [Mucilaginibacter psychrotolerans]TFF33305.1 DUF4349 domain-containing protein [Mucilaginibacter psychrotolerans]
MKTYLIFLPALMCLVACNKKPHPEAFAVTVDSVALDDSPKSLNLIMPPKPKLSAVRFPPPVVVPDAEQMTVSADNAIDEPVGNADVHQVAADKPAATIEKKIIKTGDIRFETGDVAATRKQILASLKKQGGYVEEDNQTDNGNDNRKEFVLSVKIPAANFDAFLGSVASTATKIDSKNISIKDVSTEFIDTKTRLENKKLLEARYLELLKRATKISEMLEIENKLADIRSDIESTQGQFNYLNKQVAYSSLSITFYTTQPAQVETSVGFWYKLKESFSDGYTLLQSLFFGVLSLWPYWFVLFGFYLLIKRWRNRRKAAKGA